MHGIKVTDGFYCKRADSHLVEQAPFYCRKKEPIVKAEKVIVNEGNAPPATKNVFKMKKEEVGDELVLPNKSQRLSPFKRVAISLQKEEVKVKSENLIVNEEGGSPATSDCNVNEDTDDDHGAEQGETAAKMLLLRRGNAEMTDAEASSFKCTHCGKKFKRRKNLNSHLLIHTGKKRFRCNICGETFAHSNTLANHGRIHTGEKPYRCDICGEAFAQSNTLTDHKRIHTGDKLFTCDVCGVVFTRSSNLSVHMRIHSGETPYQCDYCEKKFATKSDLVRHVRIHTGEKPFVCKVCGKSFSRNDSRKSHMRTHASEINCE